MADKKLDYYMNLPYTITLRRGTGDGDEYWIARVLELPHCMTHCPTPQAALEDIEDARREWIASNLKAGLPIPEPARFTGQYHLRMPPSLHQALAMRSESEDVSLNQFMITALARAVGYVEPPPTRAAMTRERPVTDRYSTGNKAPKFPQQL
jgi:predicted RNase H-like HicB family nuclease